MSAVDLTEIKISSADVFRPSIADLRLDWLRTRAILEERSASMDASARLSSDCEFAAAAWQNKLRTWRNDLDELLCEYPAVRQPKVGTDINDCTA